MMRSFLRRIVAAFCLAAAAIIPAKSAGVIPFALTQQIDQNGLPLRGCLLNIYVVGTTATPQQIYSDFGLTLPLPNPLTCDITGRLPSFYLADGQVHVRLTDSGGVSLIDIPVLQVVGPSTGGGGGGTVDPNAIASTGDVKFRPTSETLAGWVILNGQTIGSATSGATGRANSDTQTLFVYLWNNCPNTHCAVSTGRGATGLADFSANKTIVLLDMRGRTFFGLDQMQAAAPAGRLLASNVTSGGGDGVNTPNATGGEANHTPTAAEMFAHAHGTTEAAHAHGVTVSGTTGDQSLSHTHSYSGGTDFAGLHNHQYQGLTGSGTQVLNTSPGFNINTLTTTTDGNHQHSYSGTTNPASNGHTHTFSASATSAGAVTGLTVNSAGGGNPFNVMNGFMLGTWYQKL